MNIRDLFNAQPTPTTSRATSDDLAARRSAVVAKDLANGSASVPVFLTPQSLMSFPVATLAIKLIDIVVGSIIPAIADSNVVPFVAALLIGSLIIYYTWDSNRPRKDKVIHLAVGVLNILYLYVVAVGLDVPGLAG